MKQPSDRDIKALRRKYNELIAQAQAKCINDFQAVRDYVFNELSNLKENDALYQALETYIINRYNSMFLQLKTDIIENYNQAGIIETNFAENTMGERLRFEPALVAVLPETKPFKITNRILAEKSILKRCTKMANQVTQAIADSFATGSSIQAVQRKIDIIMGFRNIDGRINERAKALIVQGKFSHRNGHIYQTYRIARTETMRMAHIRQYEIFDGIERDDKRLKLIAVLDSRTRWQSAAMHGQISDKRGRFKYPDGVYYRLGEQPKQWVINDRETAAVVFLDNAETAEEGNKKITAEKAIKISGKETLNLSEKEKTAVKNYTDDEQYKNINKFLRGEIDKLNPKDTQTIKTLENILDKVELKADITLYRGVGADFIEKAFKDTHYKERFENTFYKRPKDFEIDDIKDYFKGKIFTEKGFMSTSFDKTKAYDDKEIMLTIKAPTGLKALNVSTLSIHDEAEMLINKGYSFKVTDVGIFKTSFGTSIWNFIVTPI